MTRPVQIIGVRPRSGPRPATSPSSSSTTRASRSRRRSRSPRSSRSRLAGRPDAQGAAGDPDDEFDQAMQDELEKQMRRAGPRHGRDHRLCAGDLPSRQGPATTSSSPRRAPRSACSFPRPARRSRRRATTTFTVVGYFKSGMSEYDSTHVYVPLERLAEVAAPATTSTASGAVNQIQIKVKPGVDLDELAEQAPARAGRAAGRCSSRSRPGSRSRARSWARSPSSRAS